ncbi:RimK family alpha-L-glutamate ligase [Streptomyces sp. NPDC050560]|uniref:RimK family alpha-L-glutamate ligase n=1 Tax=Streptomyces sp. NPDC050560 TaxID=3365630 RepID=UPI0037B7DC2F
MPALLAAVRSAGADATAVPWDDPQADWASYDLAVIRSTWDYTWRTDAFLAWAERCAALTVLANPPGVLRWNADKSYLGDLAAAGVPVVETRYLPPGEGGPGALPADREFVIKPTRGAGGRLAARHQPGDPAAAAHLAALHERGLTALVQPYQSGVDRTGERALVHLGSAPLHAVRKGAVLAPGVPYDDRKVSHPGLTPWEPTPAELAAARTALAAVPDAAGPLLYARVDLVDGDDGAPRVMELELIEPNLFLHIRPESLSAVARHLVVAAFAAEAPDAAR